VVAVRRKTFAACLVMLVVAATSSGAMSPLSGLDGGRLPAPLSERPAISGTGLSDAPACDCLTYPGALPGDLHTVVRTDAEPAGVAQPVYVLTEGRTNFHLCLCALLSLGLCRAAPWAKRLSLGVVPDWYHHGGPFQIGHSLAVSPDCLCPTLVCFVQPDSVAENPIPRYHFATVVSRWRNSQFTPAVVAPRGPPSSPNTSACI
jgi:hypothetical protein